MAACVPQSASKAIEKIILRSVGSILMGYLVQGVNSVATAQPRHSYSTDSAVARFVILSASSLVRHTCSDDSLSNE